MKKIDLIGVTDGPGAGTRGVNYGSCSNKICRSCQGH